MPAGDKFTEDDRSHGGIMDYITRISYNRELWRKPTGDARRYEQKGSYNDQFGFGHEDWLFRDEWQIDGWRYAFLQGVGKSLKRLRKIDQPFGVRLFCIEPDRRRRYVADIESIECLSEEHAEEALALFRRQGWLKDMKAEVAAVGGQVSALGNPDYAAHILNVRFRPGNVRLYTAGHYAKADDPVRFFSRYNLIEIDSVRARHVQSRKGRAGSELPPSLKPIVRTHHAKTIAISPAHSLMQRKLMQELKRKHPKAQVVREANFVDVVMTTSSERVLFEIKSSLSGASVIRQALGQLLEYLYHAGHDANRATRLVIVGRSRLSGEERSYFEWLRSSMKVDLDYHVVPI